MNTENEQREIMDQRHRVYAKYDRQFQRRGRLEKHCHDDNPRFEKPWLPREKTAAILDIGCGIGETLRSLLKSGYTNLTGVDAAEVQIVRAKEALPATVNLHHSDAINYLKAHEGQYDLIISYDIIEHFTKDEAIKFCDRVFSALRPKGVFVAKVPNSSCIIGAFGRDIDFTHLAGYTEYSLFQLFDTVGFVNHCLLKKIPKVNLRIWRPWKPFTGTGMRPRINTWLHRFLYWLAGTRPPSVFDFAIEAWTYKPNLQ